MGHHEYEAPVCVKGAKPWSGDRKLYLDRIALRTNSPTIESNQQGIVVLFTLFNSLNVTVHSSVATVLFS
jgi:hypothetical protein